MNELFDQLQSLFLSLTPDFQEFEAFIEAHPMNFTPLEQARFQTILRLVKTWQEYREGMPVVSDLLVLLRQVMRTYYRSIRIHRSLWESLRNRADSFGISATEDALTRSVLLNAEPWKPIWLGAASTIDQLEWRRKDPPVAGDGLLYAMSGSPTYQSEAQKAAIQTCLFAPPGSATLITLPTGAGKSMCVLLPAWQESQGGQIKAGTTLVVVPTVSLALDQVSRARSYFKEARTEAYQPHALLGSTSKEEEELIFRGLENGTLPILYTSPESLLNSRLYTTCLAAAEQGQLKRLVIDEAHIVETWGAGFRTEFQLLSGYQKLLLAKSKNQLRTILLSATVSEKCEELLNQLFGTGHDLQRVQANRLRPEPSYWFSYCIQEEERQKHVLEALHYLPRPLILYVTRPDDANHWYDLLVNKGFSRLAVFSGETNDVQRQSILEKWQTNQLDVIVATSAFGLGVDKGEVRSVVHACLPENLDRFYQEVGRGGRDGCSSISLSCITANDRDLAFSMTRTHVITADRAADRWQAMWKTAQGEGQRWSIDTNATPPKKKGEYQRSEVNREWNEHTLLLMQRTNLIRIRDSRDSNLQSHPNRTYFHRAEPLWLPIEILKPEVVQDRMALIAALKPRREQELNGVQADLNRMIELVRTYAGSQHRHCVAYQFGRLYPDCALACGGCPVCRQRGRPAYAEPLPLLVQAEPQPANFELIGELKDRMALPGRTVINLFWEGSRDLQQLEDLTELLVNLVASGIQQLIVPKQLLEQSEWTSALVTQLSCLEHLIPHLILPEDWPGCLPLYPLPTVVVYPAEDSAADQLYQSLKAYRQTWAKLPLINLIHRHLYLESEQGYFSDRVNGSMERLTEWQLLLAMQF